MRLVCFFIVNVAVMLHHCIGNVTVIGHLKIYKERLFKIYSQGDRPYTQHNIG